MSWMTGTPYWKLAPSPNMALKTSDSRVGVYECLRVDQVDNDKGTIRVFADDVDFLIDELRRFRRQLIRGKKNVPKIVAKQDEFPLA